MPKPVTSNARAYGRFAKHDFVYQTHDYVYVCPAGQHLTPRKTRTEANKVMYIYWTNVCGACPIRNQCTTSKERRVRRWKREAVLEGVQDRFHRNPTSVQGDQNMDGCNAL